MFAFSANRAVYVQLRRELIHPMLFARRGFFFVGAWKFFNQDNLDVFPSNSETVRVYFTSREFLGSVFVEVEPLVKFRRRVSNVYRDACAVAADVDEFVHFGVGVVGSFARHC